MRLGKLIAAAKLRSPASGADQIRRLSDTFEEGTLTHICAWPGLPIEFPAAVQKAAETCLFVTQIGKGIKSS